MTRNTRIAVAALAAGSALLGSAAVGRAAPADNAICRPFTLGGEKIQWEVVGTSTCAASKPWILKLYKDHVKSAGSVVLHNGPAGYHCNATQENAKGHVVGGVCYKGTLAFPKAGFTW
jgi:hypothetical protein